MPYNPQIQSIPIHADMSGWGNALMKYMGDKQERADKAKEEDKSFRTYMAMAKEMNLDTAGLMAKDLPTVKGLVEGTMTKNKLTELKQMADYRELQMQQMRQQMGQSAKDANAVARFNSSYRNVMTPMNIPAGTFGPSADSGIFGLAGSQAQTIGGQPLDQRAIFDISQRAGMNPLDGVKLMKEFADATPDNSLRQYTADTERMRAEAYRAQVQNGAQVIAPTDEPPDAEPPQGFVWTHDGRRWKQTRAAGMGGFPAGSKPVVLEGVHYMQGPDGTLYPTKQPTGASALSAILEKRNGEEPAKDKSAKPVKSRYTIIEE